MHGLPCQNKKNELKHNGSSHEAPIVGPFHGLKWLFSAMDGSPTMDGLAHHVDEMWSKRQNTLTQSVLGTGTQWEEECIFPLMGQFIVLLKSYLYHSNSKNHS